MGIVIDWNSGLALPTEPRGLHDKAVADGAVAVAVGQQHGVEDLAERRLLEHAVDRALRFPCR